MGEVDVGGGAEVGVKRHPHQSALAHLDDVDPSDPGELARLEQEFADLETELGKLKQGRH